MTFCTHCGKALPDGAEVCPACGRTAKLNAKEDSRGQGKITFTRASGMMSKAIKMHVLIDGKTVRKLMQYALEEGPCRGLSSAKELIPAYLEAAKRFPPGRELLQSLHDWCGAIGMQEAADLADQLLRT